jgi:hypothetical protein
VSGHAQNAAYGIIRDGFDVTESRLEERAEFRPIATLRYYDRPLNWKIAADGNAGPQLSRAMAASPRPGFIRDRASDKRTRQVISLLSIVNI